MGTASNTETVLIDLDKIKDRFITATARTFKADLLAKFVNDEELSQEARILAAEAAEGLYANVVWEDDVRGYEMANAIDIVKVRYRQANA